MIEKLSRDQLADLRRRPDELVVHSLRIQCLIASRIEVLRAVERFLRPVEAEQ